MINASLIDFQSDGQSRQSKQSMLSVYPDLLHELSAAVGPGWAGEPRGLGALKPSRVLDKGREAAEGVVLVDELGGRGATEAAATTTPTAAAGKRRWEWSGSAASASLVVLVVVAGRGRCF